jgi:hypothetical protein
MWCAGIFLVAVGKAVLKVICEDCILLHLLVVLLVKSEGERSESVHESGNEICESVEYTYSNIAYYYVNYMDLEGMYV